MAGYYAVNEIETIRVKKLNADHAAILAGGGGGGGGVSTFNTRSGAVTLISADVTAALGYTPVNPASLAAVATSGSASDLASGTLPTARLPALTGDATSSAGSAVTTVGKINGVSLAGLATGILKNTTATGAPSIAVAGDFPTLNQNTTGSAATLTTSRNFSISGGGITAATVGFNGSAAVVLSASVDAGHITLARMADMATASVLYRKTAGTGAPEVQTLATLKTDLGLTGTNSGDQTITLTGNVTGSGTGSFATTIAAGVVTLAMQANMATASVVYRKTAGSGAPEVQTLATLKTDLGLTGTNSGDQTITLTGDVTGSGTGSFAATLATVNANTGSFGSATAIPVVTVNGKGLITAVSTAANTGGWVETTLTADSATTSVSFATITDGTRSLTFTPTANANYEIQAVLLIQTATATVLPEVQINVSAQGASSYGAAQIDLTGATVTSRVTQDGTWTTGAVTIAVPAGGVAAANTPYLCYVTIRGHSGASPAAIAIQLASETAGTSVRVLAGSQMRTKVT